MIVSLWGWKDQHHLRAEIVSWAVHTPCTYEPPACVPESPFPSTGFIVGTCCSPRWHAAYGPSYSRIQPSCCPLVGGNGGPRDEQDANHMLDHSARPDRIHGKSLKSPNPCVDKIIHSTDTHRSHKPLIQRRNSWRTPGWPSECG